MSTAKEEEDTPPLLQRLLAMLEDEALFPDPMFDEDDPGRETKIAAHRDECRKAMRALFDQAAWCWDESMSNDASVEDGPALLGAKLNDQFMVLSSDWLMNYRDAIRKLAEDADTEDRDFLYFMLGTLELGWQASLRDKTE